VPCVRSVASRDVASAVCDRACVACCLLTVMMMMFVSLHWTQAQLSVSRSVAVSLCTFR